MSDQPNNALVVVDLAARKRSGTIAVGASPEGVGISPDGRWVAAAVEETNEIVFVDTRTNAKAFVVKVRGKNPEHAVFTPDGRYVFVSAEDGEAVDIIDVATRAQVGADRRSARGRAASASRPTAGAPMSPPRTSNEVYVIDAQAFKVLAKIKAGLRSNGVALHPDGKRVYVSNGGDATVSVIDLAVEHRGRDDRRSASGRGTWRSRPTARSSTSPAADPAASRSSTPARNVKIADIAVGKLPWGVVIR